MASTLYHESRYSSDRLGPSDRVPVAVAVAVCCLPISTGEIGQAVAEVYASAVPVNAYVNGIGAVSKDFGDTQMQLGLDPEQGCSSLPARWMFT